MASYQSPQDEIKELKKQIRHISNLLEYYRNLAPTIDTTGIVPPPLYFTVGAAPKCSAGYLSNGRTVLIKSNIPTDNEAVNTCWEHFNNLEKGN